MKLLIKVIILITIFVSQSYAKDNQNPITFETTHYEQELRKLLSSLNQITGVPAFSVGVVHKGNLVASVSTGYANVDKKILATDQSIFRLASVSKIVGATMLAELVVKGQLDPDEPIGRFFPEVDKKYHKITTRQLLSHSSGMPHYQLKDYDIYDKHYLSAIEALETLKGRSLLSRPGNEYLYSSHGYTLAGAIYEKISGQPLTVSIPKFIKRWTNQQTPIIENIEELIPQTSRLYAFSGSKVSNEEFGEKSYSVFGAGLSATASDLALFGYEVLNNSKSNLAYQQILFSPSLNNDGQVIENSRFQMGFGWRLGKDFLDRKVYHHAGATPGARSILVIYPEYDLSISILSNSSWISRIDKMAFSLASLYIDKAKFKPLTHNTIYQASYGPSKTTGNISCVDDTCFLSKESTEYSQWQNKFNFTGKYISDWPVFSYSSSVGDRLLLVGKTGIRTLMLDGKNFTGHINKDKSYSIMLKPKS